MQSPIQTPRQFGTVVIALALCLVVGPALAAGGSSSKKSSSSGDTTTCATGQVWDAKKHQCIRAQSGILPDEALTDYAFVLAKADRYSEAIDVLNLLQDQNTPTALNYRGYATRKMGRTEEGIGYYLKSVALDPHYAQVREYLGEAYVIMGWPAPLAAIG